MTRSLPAILLATAACTGGTTPLAELGELEAELYAWNTSPRDPFGTLAPYVLLSLRRHIDPCPTIGDDAIAMFDGMPMRLAHAGGPRENVSKDGCVPIGFELDNVPVRTGSSSMVVRDASATWTIDASDVLRADFTLEGTPAPSNTITVRWTNAVELPLSTFARITDADGDVSWSTAAGDPENQNENQSLEGNAVTLLLPAPLGGDTLTVSTGRALDTTRCQGPASCRAVLGASVDFRL